MAWAPPIEPFCFRAADSQPSAGMTALLRKKSVDVEPGQTDTKTERTGIQTLAGKSCAPATFGLLTGAVHKDEVRTYSEHHEGRVEHGDQRCVHRRDVRLSHLRARFWWIFVVG